MLSITLSVVFASARSSVPYGAGAAAPLDVSDLIADISTAPAVAAARLAALTPDQRQCQAVAHAAWCDEYDVPVAVDVVAAAYERFIHDHRSACAVPLH